MAGTKGTVIACHTKEEFDAQMAKGMETGDLVIIEFMTSWCPGCIAIAPVYADCAKKYPDAVFLKVDCEELQEVAKKYNIHSVPTFYFIRDGKTLESYASCNEDKLRDTIERYYHDLRTPAVLPRRQRPPKEVVLRYY